MEWSIHELSTAAGTTSRTLRHYGSLGILTPARTGANGYRYYDQSALVRLQRILLLRELGLGLTDIKSVLDGSADTADALRSHLAALGRERDRLTTAMRTITNTIEKLAKGEQVMVAEAFEGFDHTQYKSEVEERWGRDTYAKGDSWWRSQTAAQKQQFQSASASIAADFGAANDRQLAANCAQVQAICQRHFDWLAQTPSGPPSKEYFSALAQMYVDDERFGKNYNDQSRNDSRPAAELVRDAMVIYAEQRL
ncbi:MAG: MerR family transcriptional regulator [Antricoccus sp.]